MTVADNTSRNQYTATSGQTVFAYTFEIVDKDHIVVLQNGTVLSEGTDYTVSNVGNDNGGNVTLTSGATAGDVMTLYRDMPYSRTQNYTNSGDFLASEVNADFDELWLAGEQTDRSFSQSIRKPITDSDSISMELPDAATRADKFVKFDANGAVSVAGATTSLSADAVTIDDAGNYYDSDNVEGALQEIGAELETIPEDLESIVHINAYINPSDGSGPVSDSVALTNACNAAEVILFGGTTMDIDADWTFPVGGIARRWMFQGNTWNLTNNAEITINVDDFAIIGDGATVDGNWKIAQVNGETIDQPTTITVQSGHNFEVGDQIASSWSNSYLPNSTSRIGGSNPLSDFNEVASKTDTTITLTDQVLSTLTVGGVGESIPGNAWLINARFDKSGIEFSGANRFHIEGVTFQNMPNAYAINVNDTTESATASIVDCEINGIALDSMLFRGNALYMRNVKVRDLRDIAKQVLVWANETKPGYLYAENCDWAHSNQDGFIYAYTPETSKNFFPEMVWQNCTFDGINNNDFVPRQTYQQPCLNWASRNSTHHLIGGKATFVNCNFFNILRHVLGTTYSGVDAVTQDKMLFQNCNMDCEGAYFEIQGDDLNTNGRSICEPLIYENCNLKASNFRMNTGLGEVYFSNTIIQQLGQTNIDYFYRGDEHEETSTTTTRDYYEGEYILNTGSGLVYECTAGSGNSYEAPTGTLLTNTSYFTEKARLYYVESSATTTQAIERLALVKVTTSNTYYRCIAGGSNNYSAPSGSLLTDNTLFDRITTKIRSGHFENTRVIGDFEFEPLSDVIFDNLRLPKRTGERVPVLKGLYQSAFDNQIIFEGVDATDSTAVNPEDFFLNGAGFQDAPPIAIKIEGTDAIMVYGGGPTSLREHHYKLYNQQFDSTVTGTSPSPVRGAFLVDPLETSLVEARSVRDQHHKITVTKFLDINASASAGATTVVVTNIGNGETFDVGDWISFNNDGDSDVYFKEVTAVTGSDPYTLTINGALNEAITTSTNSCLIKHIFTNVVLDENGEVPIGLTVNGDITITEGSFEVKKEDQTNGATIDITNSFDGGGWTSGDVVGTVNFNTSDGSTSEPIRGQIKVFDDFSSSTTFPSYSAMSFSTARGNTLHERLVIDSDGNLNVAESIKFSDGTSMNTAPSGSGGLAGFDVSSYNASTSNGIFEYNIASGNQIRHLYSLNNAVAPTAYDSSNPHQVTWTISNNQQFGFRDAGGFRTKVNARAAGTTASTGLVLEGETFNNSGVEVIGNLKLSSLPTSDPSETGLLWNDGGIPVFSGSTAPSGGGLAAVVDDTTPQLGGDLDLNSNNITGTGNIDVTGTVTADDLTAQSNTPTVNLISPNGSNGYRFFSNVSDAVDGGISLQDVSASNANRLLVSHLGDISFYNDAGTSQDFYWDASTSRLGLGTTSPITDLEIKGVDKILRLTDTGSNSSFIKLETDNFNPEILVQRQGANSSYAKLVAYGNESRVELNNVQDKISKIISNSAGDLEFETDSSQKMIILDTGNVGIGTSSPATNLEVGADNPTIRLESQKDGVWTAGENLASLEFYGSDTSGVGAGVRSAIRSKAADTFGSRTELTFSVTGTSLDTEAMRITSSGHVGIGESAPDEALVVRGGLFGGNQDGGIAVQSGYASGFHIKAGFKLKSDSLGNFRAAIDSPNSTSGGTLEAISIAANSGNVGIGESAPSNTVHIKSSNPTIRLEDSDGSGAGIAQIQNTGSGNLRLIADPNNDGSSSTIEFEVDGQERIRINSSGNLLVGCTSTPSATVNGFSVNPAGVVRTSRSGTSAVSHYIFHNDNGDVGSIDTSGTSTSYTTSSDRRLKENIVDAPSASDDIDAIQVRSFDWKADGSHQKYGMIAQELNTVAPEAVSEGETEEDMMSVDYSKLVPMMLKEIQSLRARVAQLEGAN